MCGKHKQRHMKELTSNELRSLYLEFFKSKGHKVIPSASLIPENDPTVLFTTAGMHPLVPYLLGEKHPQGTRLTDVQKCVRTGDIDEVGDSSHCTFFEMLGNWSLGDYFKKEAISWSFEFLTDEKWLGIPKEELYFTCFEGDENAPKDTESHDIWRSCGVEDDHIFYLSKEHNWWGPAGKTGPCGPDTEMFIDTGKPKCSEGCNPSCSCGKYLEIWNDVFMQYNKTEDGSFVPLAQKNVDTGMGLDRTIGILQGKKSVYDTDVFTGILSKIEELSGKKYGEDGEFVKAFRIVADHVRCSTFMLGDEKGITPSNVDQGYVLRRLLRRAIRYSMQLGIEAGGLPQIAQKVVDQYKDVYPELGENNKKILSEIALEEERFTKTINQGMKEFDKLVRYLQTPEIPGKSAFRLYDTYGFPLEFTLELAKEKGFTVDVAGFDEAFRKHQEKSHEGAKEKFAGGLADHSVQTSRLHTATHLLNAALKKVLNDENIQQKGSNITAERLRFDFNFPRPLTDEEKQKVEDFVNEAIKADVPVVCTEMSVEQARAENAVGVFGAKYGELVKVYNIEGWSKEICGGPHASRTGELGHFKLVKEQSSSAGVRRIRGVLEDAQ